MTGSGTSSGATDIPFASYVLERRLAVGGMSEVFLARKREGSSETKYVLKRILPDLVEDDTIRETFEQEANLHRLVHHQNVVQFVEFGTYAGEPFIVVEHVDGCDLSKLVKRSRNEDRKLEPSICVHVARRICQGLAAVHALVDEQGKPLGVVHRDVTPSNVLLSRKGEVKLGDFGIAHVNRSVLARSSLALQGKYAYLSPEQVAGEPFDHRADLFSLAVVLTEALIGGPLFQGAGQLAVLLAIRDGRLEALTAAKSKLPPGLYEILTQALSKAPDDRYSDAAELSTALAAFDVSASKTQTDLASWVAYVADNASAARDLRGAKLESIVKSGLPPTKPSAQWPTAAELGVASSRRPRLQTQPDDVPASPRVSPDEKVICFVKCPGHPTKTVHFAKLIEMLATGQVTATDEVDFGDGYKKVEAITMLSRYLPPATQTTRRLAGPGVPDFIGSHPESSIIDALLWIVSHTESGVLFADPPGSNTRTELYFSNAKLVLAVSNEPAMLLGERLVSKGLIDRGELELAVLVMHRYNGQLGDTLIGLGLADPVEVFQAIRAQGRERVSGIFKWTSGSFAFYRGIEPARVDFQLDLDVPGLLLAGLAEIRSADELARDWAGRLDEPLIALAPKPAWARQVTWPAVMLNVLRETSAGATPRDVISTLGPKTSRGKTSFSKTHVLLAIEACHRLGIMRPKTAVP